MPCSVTHSRMLKEGSSDVSGSPTWESTSTAGPRQSTGYFPSDTGVTYTIKWLIKCQCVSVVYSTGYFPSDTGVRCYKMVNKMSVCFCGVQYWVLSLRYWC